MSRFPHPEATPLRYYHVSSRSFFLFILVAHIKYIASIEFLKNNSSFSSSHNRSQENILTIDSINLSSEQSSWLLISALKSVIIDINRDEVETCVNASHSRDRVRLIISVYLARSLSLHHFFSLFLHLIFHFASYSQLSLILTIIFEKSQIFSSTHSLSSFHQDWIIDRSVIELHRLFILLWRNSSSKIIYNSAFSWEISFELNTDSSISFSRTLNSIFWTLSVARRFLWSQKQSKLALKNSRKNQFDHKTELLIEKICEKRWFN